MISFMHQCKYLCYIDKEGHRRGVCVLCEQDDVVKIHNETRGTYDYTKFDDSYPRKETA